mmetsp:Transcript_33004/g.82405  ORF Transcript_33004/g.82405 Transcript_33004/m.82405 type:complete len:296 (-) Transcript_33004:721-1608(-)
MHRGGESPQTAERSRCCVPIFHSVQLSCRRVRAAAASFSPTAWAHLLSARAGALHALIASLRAFALSDLAVRSTRSPAATYAGAAAVLAASFSLSAWAQELPARDGALHALTASLSAVAPRDLAMRSPRWPAATYAGAATVAGSLVPKGSALATIASRRPAHTELPMIGGVSAAMSVAGRCPLAANTTAAWMVCAPGPSIARASTEAACRATGNAIVWNARSCCEFILCMAPRRAAARPRDAVAASAARGACGGSKGGAACARVAKPPGSDASVLARTNMSPSAHSAKMSRGLVG